MTEQKQFGVDEVLAALEAAVAKRGEDYRYTKPEGSSVCLYVHDRDTDSPTPGCIVGQVYFDLTGDLVPKSCEGGGASDILSGITEAFTFTEGALGVLDRAQSRQDNGFSWGIALAAEKQRAAEV